MTLKQLDIDNDIRLDDSETGKFYLFWNKDWPAGVPLGLSSKLENVGIVEKHDCWLENKIKVLVLSDPTEAFHPRLGKILVSQIMAHKIMWVGTNSLHLIEE